LSAKLVRTYVQQVRLAAGSAAALCAIAAAAAAALTSPSAALFAIAAAWCIIISTAHYQQQHSLLHQQLVVTGHALRHKRPQVAQADQLIELPVVQLPASKLARKFGSRMAVNGGICSDCR
jgi:hypothetical protein